MGSDLMILISWRSSRLRMDFGVAILLLFPLFLAGWQIRQVATPQSAGCAVCFE